MSDLVYDRCCRKGLPCLIKTDMLDIQLCEGIVQSLRHLLNLMVFIRVFLFVLLHYGRNLVLYMTDTPTVTDNNVSQKSHHQQQKQRKHPGREAFILLRCRIDRLRAVELTVQVFDFHLARSHSGFHHRAFNIKSGVRQLFVGPSPVTANFSQFGRSIHASESVSFQKSTFQMRKRRIILPNLKEFHTHGQLHKVITCRSLLVRLLKKSESLVVLFL